MCCWHKKTTGAKPSCRVMYNNGTLLQSVYILYIMYVLVGSHEFVEEAYVVL